MKMARLRKTGVEVVGDAVEVLWQRVYSLWTQDPLAFIELVRHARKRSHEINDPMIQRILYQGGFLGDTRGLPVHDAVRELIAATVEGDGIRMLLFRPFADDNKAVSEIVTLRSGDAACLHIVQWAMKKLQEIMVADYVLFTELVRYVRDKKDPQQLFGNSLTRLLRMRIFRFRIKGDLMAQAYHAFLESMLGSILIDGPRELVCEPVLELVIVNAVTGTTGLSFKFQDPVQPRKGAKTESSGAPGNNGHPRPTEASVN